MPTLNDTEANQLERLIDSYSLAHVIDALYVICVDKAEHIVANWQDNVTARGWRDAAARLDALSGRIKV